MRQEIDGCYENVKIYIDIDLYSLIQAPGNQQPVTQVQKKRGDGLEFDIQFVSQGVVQDLGVSPTLQILFGAKVNLSDTVFTVSSTTFTKTGTGVNAVYTIIPSLNTTPLNTAIGIGGTQIPSVSLMGEICWINGSALPETTSTFTLLVLDDIIQGDEGVPTSGAGAYPPAADLVVLADVSTTPTANLIPVAGTGGTIADGWLSATWATVAGVASSIATAVAGCIPTITSPVNGNIPLQNGSGLTSGLPVSATPAASTVVKSGTGGTISDGWISSTWATVTGVASSIATAVAGYIPTISSPVSGNLPQSTGTGTLTTGLPVSATPAASTVVKSGTGGTISDGWISSTWATVSSVTSAITSALAGYMPLVGGGTVGNVVKIGSGGTAADTGVSAANLQNATALQGVTIVTTAPTTGQLLEYNGTNWVPTTVAAGGGGTVTSVNVSPGSTGLTFAGGPVTGSGTITAGGVLGAGFGGTGQTSLSASILAMLPSLTGNAGLILTVNSGATGIQWSSVSAGITSIPVNLSLYVDLVNGNNTTAVAGDASKPFATVAGALAMAVSGDNIYVRPGNDNASWMSSWVSGVNLICDAGYTNTYTGSNATIFGDNGTAMTFNVYGRGVFIHNGSATTPRVFSFTAASTGIIEAKQISLASTATTGAVIYSNAAATITTNVDTLQTNSAVSGQAIYELSGTGTCYGVVKYLNGASTGTSTRYSIINSGYNLQLSGEVANLQGINSTVTGDVYTKLLYVNLNMNYLAVGTNMLINSNYLYANGGSTYTFNMQGGCDIISVLTKRAATTNILYANTAANNTCIVGDLVEENTSYSSAVNGHYFYHTSGNSSFQVGNITATTSVTTYGIYLNGTGDMNVVINGHSNSMIGTATGCAGDMVVRFSEVDTSWQTTTSTYGLNFLTTGNVIVHAGKYSGASYPLQTNQGTISIFGGLFTSSSSMFIANATTFRGSKIVCSGSIAINIAHSGALALAGCTIIATTNSITSGSALTYLDYGGNISNVITNTNVTNAITGTAMIVSTSVI